MGPGVQTRTYGVARARSAGGPACTHAAGHNETRACTAVCPSAAGAAFEAWPELPLPEAEGGGSHEGQTTEAGQTGETETGVEGEETLGR
jgi:hypothetical protein